MRKYLLLTHSILFICIALAASGKDIIPEQLDATNDKKVENIKSTNRNLSGKVCKTTNKKEQCRPVRTKYWNEDTADALKTDATDAYR